MHRALLKHDAPWHFLPQSEMKGKSNPIALGDNSILLTGSETIDNFSKRVAERKITHLLLDSNPDATGANLAACLSRNSCYKRIRWQSSDDADLVVRIAATMKTNTNKISKDSIVTQQNSRCSMEHILLE